jgi:hypothetical protein
MPITLTEGDADVGVDNEAFKGVTTELLDAKAIETKTPVCTAVTRISHTMPAPSKFCTLETVQLVHTKSDACSATIGREKLAKYNTVRLVVGDEVFVERATVA